MELFIWTLIFFTGGCFASAANCLIYRINNGKDWVHGRSVCESCGRQLKWYELIPVVSCILLRGKCRTCGHFFGYGHATKEALVGFLSIFLYITGDPAKPTGVFAFWAALILVSYIIAKAVRKAKQQH